MSDLGDYLKKLRGSISLREAAKRSGLSHSYINSLEVGTHPKTGVPINPSPEMLKGLAKAYNHPYKDLMVRAGYSYDEIDNASIEETEREKENRELSDLITHIKDPIKKEQAISYLRFLANSPTDGAKK